MSEHESIDHAAFRAWIGRTETAADVVTPRLVEQLIATLNNDPEQSTVSVPHLVHWCLAPPAAQTRALGTDGHPARGGFLPPVPLPRRMWAGGHVTFSDHLRIGDRVERHTTITDVTVKQGRAGPLCFVSLAHEITTPRGAAILERQDIVYSGIAKPAPNATPPVLPQAQWRQDCTAGPVLLFRYSALTFNGHRIHYDRSYATEIEHYPGLLVHGPLQATLLVEFAASIKNRPPLSFKFRGLKPLFDFAPFALCARETETGLHLWVQTQDGVQTMDMEAAW